MGVSAFSFSAAFFLVWRGVFLPLAVLGACRFRERGSGGGIGRPKKELARWLGRRAGDVDGHAEEEIHSHIVGEDNERKE